MKKRNIFILLSGLSFFAMASARTITLKNRSGKDVLVKVVANTTQKVTLKKGKSQTVESGANLTTIKAQFSGATDWRTFSTSNAMIRCQKKLIFKITNSAKTPVIKASCSISSEPAVNVVAPNTLM